MQIFIIVCQIQICDSTNMCEFLIKICVDVRQSQAEMHISDKIQQEFNRNAMQSHPAVYINIPNITNFPSHHFSI